MIVDTNVLVRSIAGQVGPHSDAARARVAVARGNGDRLTVLSATVLEFTFVLSSPNTGFGWPRERVLAALSTLLDESAFDVEHAEALRAATDAYGRRRIALHDCFLDALAARRGVKVLSFDDDLRKLGNRELP